MAVALLSGVFSGCSDRGRHDEPTMGANEINLFFRVQMPMRSRAATPLPAEQIRSLRVVMVDLGVSSDGQWLNEPFVEFNQMLTNGQFTVPSNDGSITEDGMQGVHRNDGIVEVNIPRIQADKRKKMYIIINAEPAWQPSLNLRLADGTPVSGYGDESLFLPDANGSAPIENAVFVAPRGSYINNELPAGEELLTPMTAFYEFSVPSLKYIEEKYPTFNPRLTYPLPGELLVVRAVNKVWFEFVNATNQEEDHTEPLDLLVTNWSLSDVNFGDSYLFGHPEDNDGLFKSYVQNENNLNSPWMQWIYVEAQRSQTDSPYQWLTDYDMPEGMANSVLSFSPNKFNGGVPADADGIYLKAPATYVGETVKTELLPVYFAESHAGSPQQYEMTFTVYQRDNKGERWSNPHVYRVTSSPDANDQDTFHLLSLFRNTDVIMEVRFVTGRTGVEMKVEVHPYGSVILEPGFGL